MRRFSLRLVTVMASALFVLMPLAYANDAPVVDITQNSDLNQQQAVPAPAATSVAQVNTNSDETDLSATSVAAAAATNSNMTAATPNTVNTLQQLSQLPVNQRLARLEQQMANLIQMNLPQQITDMQQQLQQLSGQLQVQEHDLKLLNDQQRSFYQDLQQQITQLKNLSGNGASVKALPKDTKALANISNNNIKLKDSNTYKAAFELLSKRQYAKAKQAFQNYLNDYPNGDFLVNAHYWLGEIFLLEKDNSNASKQFTAVIQNFPKSSKVPDARLKLAIIHANTGKVAQARKELRQIQKQYPDSTAAQLASIQLQQLAISDNGS